MLKSNDEKNEIDLRRELPFAYSFSTGRNWIVLLMNLHDKGVKIAGETYEFMRMNLLII